MQRTESTRYTPDPTRRSFRSLSLVALVVGVAACVTNACAAPVETASSVESFFPRFESAYESGDVAAYGALLAPEFRFHFGDAETANLVTSDAVDPISAMPEFKATLVRLSRLAPAERLEPTGAPA